MGTELNIPDWQEIRNVRGLENSIRFLKMAVNDGFLIQFGDNQLIGGSKELIGDLQIQGPYPDNIIMNFYSPQSGKKYELSVDTYHGSGGEWKLMDD